MKNARLLTFSCLLTALLAPAPSKGEEFLLYVPKPASGDQLPSSPDQGVLVRRVTVKRGDTLAKLARKHIGVASWFPQVLLFNNIKNADLIHPGDRLLVPVPTGRAALRSSAKGKKHHAGRRSSPPRKAAVTPLTAVVPLTAVAPLKTEIRPAMSDEQEIFQRAKGAYLSSDYQKALDLFDGFTRKFPHSALAADASLYKADCLLKLSGE
jgi:LysM repeat protein